MKKYAFMIMGTFLFALSVNLFLIPSKIVTGGLSGLATIIYYKTGISVGAVVALGNVIMCIVAWFYLGRTFVLNSLFGIVSITLFVSITERLSPLTKDPFLAAVFGGILMGIGIGMTFIQGGTTGGTDIISRISQHIKPEFSIGVIMTVVDLAVIGISALVFGDYELTMYGIISLFVSTAVIDGIISHLNSGVLVFIITPNYNAVKEVIYNYVKRGVTVLDAVGGYSLKKKKILMCVMKKKEVEELKKFSQVTNEENFMIVTSSKEVFGEGFRYYR